jgi:ornithine decarboxylase
MNKFAEIDPHMFSSHEHWKFFDKNALQNKRHHTPFFAFSPHALCSAFKTFKIHLPDKTEICYAMKANSEKKLLEILHICGSSFEISSKNELNLLSHLKVPPQKIIYGAPVREHNHIKAAATYGVDRYAFDCEQELYKIAKYCPHARVYVRALVDHRSDSIFHMSEKFGVPLNEAKDLLLKAKNLGLIPYGISFNVGSQARSTQAWGRGISQAAGVMKDLLREGIKISIINMGGGFPIKYGGDESYITLKEIYKYIALAEKELPYNIEYIAEPGRALCAKAYKLITTVIQKKYRSDNLWLYVDAGVYQGLFEALACQGSIKYDITPLRDHCSDPKTKHFIVTGPTCDDLDIIGKDMILPENIDVGDRLVIHDAGAYSFALMTNFNGFAKPRVVTFVNNFSKCSL